MNNQIRQWTKDYISAVVEKQQVEDPEEPHSDQYQVELEHDPNGAVPMTNPLEHADPMSDPINFGDEDEDEDHLHPAQNGAVPASGRMQAPSGGRGPEDGAAEPTVNRTKWQKIKQRFPYYVPIFYWLPHYNWKRDFTKDFVAGLGVASMIIPQSLACAILATVDPIYGLYTALFPGLIYALMGTSRQLSVGPDAMIALLVALELGHLRERSEELMGHGGEEHEFDANLVSHALAFLVGLFLFAGGLIRVGFLDNIFSRALLGGFVNAVALIIIFEQLDTLFGVKDKNAGPEDHGWRKLPYLFETFGEHHCPNNLLLGNCVHLPTMTAAFISIGFMIGFRMIKKHAGKIQGMAWIRFVPENLLVVIVAIIVSYSAKLEEHYHMKILGEMEAKFPVPTFPHFGSYANFKINLSAAGTIAVIGFIESIVVAKLYANKNNYYVSPNRELVAIGLSNFIGSFFQAFPTFGSLTRSSVADMMGAQTQLFTLITSFIILLTIFLLAPLFSLLPKVVMSSIIFVAATGLFEFEDVEFMWKIKAWKDLTLFLLTFAMTVILGVDLGIFLSIGISLFFVVKYSSLPHLGILGRVPETKKYKDIKQVTEARIIPGILIVRIEEALYFANIEMIKQMLSRIERVGNPKAHPGDKRRGWALHSIIIHSRNIPDMDASAIQVLAEMVEKYHERNIFVCFVKLREKLRHLFVRAHIIENAHSDIRLFESVDDAVTFVEDRVQKGEADGTDLDHHH